MLDKNIGEKDDDGEIYLPIILNEVVKLFQNKSNNKIIIENNQIFGGNRVIKNI